MQMVAAISHLRRWSTHLFDTRMPGARATAPTPQAKVFLIVSSWMLLHCWLRYRVGFGTGRQMFACHTALCFAVCAAVIWWVHGREIFARVQRRTWGILAASFCLISIYWYVGRTPYIWMQPPRWDVRQLKRLRFFYFSLMSIVLRLLVPFVGARVLWRLTPGDLGLSSQRNPYAPGVAPIWPIYLALLAGVMPFVVLASRLPSFRSRYPFPAGMVRPDGSVGFWDFLTAQIAYFGIFLSGESFWRGFICFGVEADFGAYGILFMMAPYVCAHFGKPMLEAMGATGAGLTLGWLALKHRSVWHGVFLHYIVALSMDLLALR